jgi:hypothetical protein
MSERVQLGEVLGIGAVQLLEVGHVGQRDRRLDDIGQRQPAASTPPGVRLAVWRAAQPARSRRSQDRLESPPCTGTAHLIAAE